MASQMNYAPSNWSSSSSNSRRNGSGRCGFCFQNKEPINVYSQHLLKDHTGRITCPQLFKHICEVCGATGEQAHTRSYCPNIIAMRQALNSTSTTSNQREIRSQGSAKLTKRSPSPTSSNNKSNNNKSNNYNFQRSAPEAADKSLQISHDRRFKNMAQLSSSRYNSAGRLRKSQPNQAEPPRPIGTRADQFAFLPQPSQQNQSQSRQTQHGYPLIHL